MRVIVTGAGGFIGSHVVRALVSRSHEVIAWTRPGSDPWRLANLSGGWRHRIVELGDSTAVGEALDADQPDALIHCAWFAEPRVYLTSSPDNLRSLGDAVDLFQQLLDGPCRRVVVVGTYLEDLDAESTWPYVAAKRGLHQACRVLRGPGRTTVCAHVHHVFGPMEQPDRVVPSVTCSLLAGQDVAAGDARQLRDYLYVSDVASGLVALVEATIEGAVAVRSGTRVELRSVLEAIHEQIGGTGHIRFGELPDIDRGLDVRDGSPAELQALGWWPRYTLSEGLTKTIDWWRSEGSGA